jgi:hypothetical protein
VTGRVSSPASVVDELRALLERYARAADERDVDALAVLFTADAIVVGTRGEQTIATWLDTMREPRTFPMSMHVFGNPLVELSTDGSQATLDTYAVVYQLGDAASGQRDLTLGMRYVDDVVRDGDAWRIRARRATSTWMR